MIELNGKQVVWSSGEINQITYYTDYPTGSFRTKMFIALLRKHGKICFHRNFTGQGCKSANIVSATIRDIGCRTVPHLGYETDVLHIQLKNVVRGKL